MHCHFTTHASIQETHPRVIPLQHKILSVRKRRNNAKVVGAAVSCRTFAPAIPQKMDEHSIALL
jgi:hypothetical protein